MNEINKPMAHEEAVEHHAVESYLLNELTEEERSRFEEHYFECTACADAVMAGQAFIGGIHPPEPWWRRLGSWVTHPVKVPLWGFSMAAAGVAALALFTLPTRTISPIVMANTSIVARDLQMGDAGDEKPYRVNTPSATVEANLYGVPQFPFYQMTIERSGKEIASEVLAEPAQDASHMLSLQVAAKTLGSGTFDVKLSGLEKATSATPKALATYHFRIAQ